MGKKDLFVDLGAERLLAADKEGRKIAVEVKSFLGASEVADLENALGQYILYREILGGDRAGTAHLPGCSVEVYEELFTEPIGQLVLSERICGSSSSTRTRESSFNGYRNRVLSRTSSSGYSQSMRNTHTPTAKSTVNSSSTGSATIISC